MKDHFRDAGSVPHVFVRFNPDRYWDEDGRKIAGCWTASGRTRRPGIALRQKEQWQNRLDLLALTVRSAIGSAPTANILPVYLFYGREEPCFGDLQL